MLKIKITKIFRSEAHAESVYSDLLLSLFCFLCSNIIFEIISNKLYKVEIEKRIIKIILCSYLSILLNIL